MDRSGGDAAVIFMPGIVCQGDKRLTWAKYAVVYTEVENGTFSTWSGALWADSFHYMSNAYTVSGSSFVLTDPVHRVPRNFFNEYKYLVDVKGNGSNAKSGKTLYMVEEVTSEAELYEDERYTGYYAKGKTYTLSPSKGAYIGEVKASEGTYPDNGAQGGYWYVLLN